MLQRCLHGVSDGGLIDPGNQEFLPMGGVLAYLGDSTNFRPR